MVIYKIERRKLPNRSVRLDVLATDSKGRRMNVEIQRSDKGAGYKRARFNSSMLDAGLLQKSERFEDLPDTWVIFITEHDIPGRGKAVYQVERRFADTLEPFHDGSHILYVNGAYRDETPIGKLMHDFSCTNPADMNYGVLAERVRFFKESKEGVAIMCKVIEEMRLQERLEGHAEGRAEGLQEVAANMLRAGKYALEEIAALSGLSLDDVNALRAKLSM